MPPDAPDVDDDPAIVHVPDRHHYEVDDVLDPVTPAALAAVRDAQR